VNSVQGKRTRVNSGKKRKAKLSLPQDLTMDRTVRVIFTGGDCCANAADAHA